jgi:osmotically-inducible protein OsmY
VDPTFAACCGSDRRHRCVRDGISQPTEHSDDQRTGPGQDVTNRRTCERARESAAEIGEKAGVAASTVGSTLEEAALTTKIKAKMALDDVVKARSIDVTTRGTTVTLSGVVQSRTEHDRAMALARETEGVTDVIDDLKMLQRVG